jgi:hypothetical protein
VITLEHFVVDTQRALYSLCTHKIFACQQAVAHYPESLSTLATFAQKFAGFSGDDLHQ